MTEDMAATPLKGRPNYLVYWRPSEVISSEKNFLNDSGTGSCHYERISFRLGLEDFLNKLQSGIYLSENGKKYFDSTAELPVQNFFLVDPHRLEEFAVFAAHRIGVLLRRRILASDHFKKIEILGYD